MRPSDEALVVVQPDLVHGAAEGLEAVPVAQVLDQLQGLDRLGVVVGAPGGGEDVVRLLRSGGVHEQAVRVAHDADLGQLAVRAALGHLLAQAQELVPGPLVLLPQLVGRGQALAPEVVGVVEDQIGRRAAGDADSGQSLELPLVGDGVQGDLGVLAHLEHAGLLGAVVEGLDEPQLAPALGALEVVHERVRRVPAADRGQELLLHPRLDQGHLDADLRVALLELVGQGAVAHEVVLGAPVPEHETAGHPAGGLGPAPRSGLPTPGQRQRGGAAAPAPISARRVCGAVVRSVPPRVPPRSPTLPPRALSGSSQCRRSKTFLQVLDSSVVVR